LAAGEAKTRDHHAADSRLTAPNHQSSLEHAFAHCSSHS
jgi:hypothetical protein